MSDITLVVHPSFNHLWAHWPQRVGWAFHLCQKKKKILAWTPMSVAWELIPFSGALGRRGLHPIKLAYDLVSAGWPVQLTASAFNRLGQYASSPDNRAYCYAEVAISPLALLVLIAPIHEGMSRLSWSEGVNVIWTCEQSPIPVLTGPNVGWRHWCAQCRYHEAKTPGRSI